ERQDRSGQRSVTGEDGRSLLGLRERRPEDDDARHDESYSQAAAVGFHFQSPCYDYHCSPTSVGPIHSQSGFFEGLSPRKEASRALIEKILQKQIRTDNLLTIALFSALPVHRLFAPYSLIQAEPVLFRCCRAVFRTSWR